MLPRYGPWIIEVNLVSLNRLSIGCVTTPRRQSGVLAAFEYYRRDLNNAATSRTLANLTVISSL